MKRRRGPIHNSANEHEAHGIYVSRRAFASATAAVGIYNDTVQAASSTRHHPTRITIMYCEKSDEI